MCGSKKYVMWYLTGILILLAGCAATTSSKERSEAKKYASNDMVQIMKVRRLLRLSCERLMDIIAWDEGVQVPPPRRAYLKMTRVSPPPTGAKELFEAAERDVVLANNAWQALLASTKGQAPAEYSNVPDWKSSSEKITDWLSEMLSLIREASAPKAMEACGKICNAFNGINTSAGIVGISEKLFGFRQLARPLFEYVVKSDISALQQIIPKLREAISDLPALPGDRGEAIKRFSEAAQVFIAAVEQKDEMHLVTAYGRMMAAFEQAYDACL